MKISTIEYKIYKVGFFSFSFKLNEKGSVVKKYDLGRVLQENFC